MKAQGAGGSDGLKNVLDLLGMRRRIRASLGGNDAVGAVKREGFLV